MAMNDAENPLDADATKTLKDTLDTLRRGDRVVFNDRTFALRITGRTDLDYNKEATGKVSSSIHLTGSRGGQYKIRYENYPRDHSYTLEHDEYDYTSSHDCDHATDAVVVARDASKYDHDDPDYVDEQPVESLEVTARRHEVEPPVEVGDEFKSEVEHVETWQGEYFGYRVTSVDRENAKVEFAVVHRPESTDDPTAWVTHKTMDYGSIRDRVGDDGSWQAVDSLEDDPDAAPNRDLQTGEWLDTAENDETDAQTDADELREEWVCDDCGHVETAAVDALAGRQIKKTVGEHPRVEVIETAVCPECYSENWHSESVRDAFLDGGEVVLPDGGVDLFDRLLELETPDPVTIHVENGDELDATVVDREREPAERDAGDGYPARGYLTVFLELSDDHVGGPGDDYEMHSVLITVTEQKPDEWEDPTLNRQKPVPKGDDDYKITSETVGEVERVEYDESPDDASDDDPTVDRGQGVETDSGHVVPETDGVKDPDHVVEFTYRSSRSESDPKLGQVASVEWDKESNQVVSVVDEWDEHHRPTGETYEVRQTFDDYPDVISGLVSVETADGYRRVGDLVEYRGVGPTCPECGSVLTAKSGHTKNGRGGRRVPQSVTFCRDCGYVD